jgi:hypothetical protein
MEQGQSNPDKNTPPEKEAGKQTPDNPSRQKADDKSRQDADEKLPEHKKSVSDHRDPKEIDDMVQGKKLEEKYRGGDTTDADDHVAGR